MPSLFAISCDIKRLGCCGLRWNSTALVVAAEFSSDLIVKLLLERKANPNSIYEGYMLWGNLICVFYVRALRWLANLLYNLWYLRHDRAFSFRRTTALNTAIKCNSAQIINQLLDSKADVNSQDEHGYLLLFLCKFCLFRDTPLINSLCSHFDCLTDQLLKLKADPHIKNNTG